MENKNVPPRADEKTKVISVNPTPANKPAPVGNTPSQGTASTTGSKPNQQSPFASYFSNGNSKAKRTIIAGAVGGGLLVSLLALTSFKKPDEEVPADGTGIGSSDPKDISEGEVVTINTGHEVYTGLNDDKTLDQAREIARENVGSQGLFMYKEEVHPAMTNEEWNNQTGDEKLDYINKINVTPPAEDDVVTLPVEVNGEMMNLKVDPLHKADLIQIGTDDSGDVFVIPQGREAIQLHNISIGENGTYYRTDPDTGELSVFTLEQVFTQLDEHGKAEVEVLVPGIDHPVIEGTYMYGAGEEIGDWGAHQSGYGWGWDTDGDGVIDKFDDDYPVTDEPDPDLMPVVDHTNVIVPDPNYFAPIEKSDEELLDERILQMAKEGGIDDIRKIKKHQNDDGSWDIKIKGDDGDKIKTTITAEELHSGHHDAVVGTIDYDGDNGDTGVDDGNIISGEVIPDGTHSDGVITSDHESNYLMASAGSHDDIVNNTPTNNIDDYSDPSSPLHPNNNDL